MFHEIVWKLAIVRLYLQTILAEYVVEPLEKSVHTFDLVSKASEQN